MKDGRLWGLIACHHTTAKTIPYQVRVSCEILARVFSAHIPVAEEEDTRRGWASLREFAGSFAKRLRAAPNVRMALLEEGAQLANVIRQGIAICIGDQINLSAILPAAQRWTLSGNGWMRTNRKTSFTRISSPSIVRVTSSAIDATGLLSISALADRDFILWFRPPATKVVEWAGNPSKPVEETEKGKRISPRLSFERWKKT